MTFDWDTTAYAKTSDLQAEMGYKLIEALDPQPCEKVLGLGCGIGNLAIFAFKNALSAYGFLQAVGISLYMTPLGSPCSDYFARTVLKEVEKIEDADGVVFHFERIIASATVAP